MSGLGLGVVQQPERTPAGPPTVTQLVAMHQPVTHTPELKQWRWTIGTETSGGRELWWFAYDMRIVPGRYGSARLAAHRCRLLQSIIGSRPVALVIKSIASMGGWMIEVNGVAAIGPLDSAQDGLLVVDVIRSAGGRPNTALVASNWL